MLTESEIWIALWCAFALACGGLIKGALGVGTPLLTVPLMALVLPPQTAIAIMAIPVVVANLWQTWKAPRTSNVVARFWPAFLAIIIGILIGVKILVSIDERSLLLIVGTAVIVFTLLQGSSYRLEIPPSMVRPAGAVFGLGSGLIGGISSFFGPMLIIYLVSIPRLGKDEFVGSISFLYIGAVLPWTATLIYHGVLDGQLLLYSTLAAIPVSLGMLLGQKLRTFIADHHFNRLILGILLCSGGAILWRAFA